MTFGLFLSNVTFGLHFISVNTSELVFPKSLAVLCPIQFHVVLPPTWLTLIARTHLCLSGIDLDLMGNVSHDYDHSFLDGLVQ